MGKIETTVFIPDVHCPHADKHALYLVLCAIASIKPQRVVLLGDVLDFGSVSRFDQDPRFAEHLADELEEGKHFLDDLRQVSGNAEIHYLEGNHEHRLVKHLIRNDKEMMFLRDGDEEVISVPHLLDLKKRKIIWHPQDTSLFLHNWCIEHGDIASQHAGYTAKRMVERRRMNVIMGHTHRLGLFSHTGFASTLIGVEAGCLIDRNSPAASYARFPNWQTGFCIGEAYKDIFQVTPIAIQNGTFILKDRVYNRGTI